MTQKQVEYVAEWLKARGIALWLSEDIALAKFDHGENLPAFVLGDLAEDAAHFVQQQGIEVPA